MHYSINFVQQEVSSLVFKIAKLRATKGQNILGVVSVNCEILISAFCNTWNRGIVSMYTQALVPKVVIIL